MRLNLIRQAVANYMRSEGCDCCRDSEAHRKHRKILGKILRVKKFADKSGYDFSLYETKRNPVKT